jgi:hypothetical protein
MGCIHGAQRAVGMLILILYQSVDLVVTVMCNNNWILVYQLNP